MKIIAEYKHGTTDTINYKLQTRFAFFIRTTSKLMIMAEYIHGTTDTINYKLQTRFAFFIRTNSKLKNLMCVENIQTSN